MLEKRKEHPSRRGATSQLVGPPLPKWSHRGPPRLSGEWKATWVDLDEVGPYTNANGPTPAGPLPTLKQVWKPVGPRPTRPAPQKEPLHNSGPQSKLVKPATHTTQVTAPILELSTYNLFYVFEVGDSSGTSETQPINTLPQPGLSQGSPESALLKAPALATEIP